MGGGTYSMTSPEQYDVLNVKNMDDEDDDYRPFPTYMLGCTASPAPNITS